MALPPKNGALLYHLTAIDNLGNIILNGLRPRAELLNFKDVADHEILADREKFNLQLYTPFHFFAGSPFASKVQIENPDVDFIFITIKRERAAVSNFYIVPNHPLRYNGEPLEWNEGIESIDWDLMAQRDYRNHDCKEACMSEALFKGVMSVGYFHCIYVKNEQTKKRVETVLQQHNCREIAFVTINSTFFVNQ